MPLVLPDAEGWYPVAMPGKTEALQVVGSAALLIVRHLDRDFGGQ